MTASGETVDDDGTNRNCMQLWFYLDHREHSLIRDGICADGEVSRRVAADDSIDSVPVWAVGLIPVHHRQVGYHDVHLVLRHLTGKLHRGGREWTSRREKH